MTKLQDKQPTPPRAAAMGSQESEVLAILANQYQASGSDSQAELAMAGMVLGMLAGLGAGVQPHPAAGCPRCMSAVCCCVAAAECCEDARQPATSTCVSLLKRAGGFFCGVVGLPTCCCLTLCCCGCCDKVEPTDRVKAGYLPPSLRG